MNEAESRYTTTEKEMLAVVYAFEKFRSYLVMNKCTVYTVSIRPQVSLFKEDSKGRLLDGFCSCKTEKKHSSKEVEAFISGKIPFCFKSVRIKLFGVVFWAKKPMTS
ncbi:reverse transcriptase domain-containing protein [Tanacetum coccineum]